MMLKKVSGILLMLSLPAMAQLVQDTIVLDEAVYTGQVSAQKMDQSVYEVKVITEEQIRQSAALNLADLMNQMLNIQVIPNASTGKSGLDMLGMNSQYVKVLVDNIPIINDEGLGNFTDFTQINLSDIEQIEIVEGAMGVEYGADAVAGVINIITKKRSREGISANLFIQEESIGDEYELYRKGRHIKGVDVKGRITDKLHAGISYNQNDFKGYFGEKSGQKYDLNDGLRGFEWLPKQQYDAKAFLSYQLNSTKLFYRFNYFNEALQFYDELVTTNYEPATGLNNPTSQDIDYTTQRWYHLFNVNGKFSAQTHYDFTASYQTQTRDANFYTYHILNDARTDEDEFTYEKRKTWYGKGLLEHTFIPAKWSGQLGFEVNQVDGVQSPLARSYDSGTLVIDRSLGSYDVFASTDYHINDDIIVRPGIRAMFSNIFDTQLAYSLSASYLFGNQWELRGLIGNSPKNPSYEELFTYFVDSNHYVVGNENLKAERGLSYSLHLKKEKKLGEKITWRSKLSARYIEVKDQIDLLIINQEPLQYEFRNFDTFSSRGATFSNEFISPRLRAEIGVTYNGAAYESYNNDVLYAWQGNLLLSYFFPEAKLNLFASYKYNGPQYTWLSGLDDAGNEIIYQGKQEAYSWLDLSVKKEFFQDWQLVVGARNVLDIVNLQTTAQGAEAHSAPATSRLLGYGRSYFVRINYNIPFN